MAEQGFVSKYQKKVEQEEKELEELLAAQKNTVEDEDEEDSPVVDDKEEDDPEEQTWKQRYADLRRHSQKQAKEFKERLEALEKERPAAVEPEIPSTVKEMEEWKEKYPDVARIIETMVERETEKRVKNTELAVQEVRESYKEKEKETALEKILAKHKDFYDIEASDEFHDWVEDQPKWMQTALYDQQEDAKSVIRILDLYKMETGAAEKEKVKQKETEKDAARDTSTKKSRPAVDEDSQNGKIKESWVNSLSIKDFEKNEEKITEAIKTGNFIYDLTGAAR